MRCPHCGNVEDKVVESRSLAGGTAIRRRRECADCGYRYTSYERIEERPLMVVKSGGHREQFIQEKLERGILQAVRKRPVSPTQVEEILISIEDQAMLEGKVSHEVPSRRLGEMVLERLYKLDRVAYVRFASVYRNFENVEEFLAEIARLKEQQLEP